MAQLFIDAAKDGNLDILEKATKKDLNTGDEDGMTPTHWVAHKGHLDALKCIVGRQGNINKSDYLGFTALHHAVMRGHVDIVIYLVHCGCNIYAVDNELHSAMDIAAMHERRDVIKFLDNELARRQSKNPQHMARQREEAIKTAKSNIKRYDKMLETASKKRDKEEKNRQRELSHLQPNTVKEENKPRKSFFKTITLRGTSGRANAPHSQKSYSDVVGMSGGTRKGIAKKLQMKRNDAMVNSKMNSDFRISAVDSDGNRTVRSLGPDQGFVGSTSQVMYMTSSKVKDDTPTQKRTVMSADFFQKTNIYKAKSESDLLDSGVDSYNGDDEDEDNAPGLFNRPHGKLAFLQKNPFLSTLQSFEDTSPTEPLYPDDRKDDFLRSHRLSGDGEEGRDTFENGSDRYGDDTKHHHQPLPWDQDDLDNLDDDEEDVEENELSAVNMFLWSCGQASLLHIFSKEKVDMPMLMELTDAELKELGLKEFGPRKRLRDAILKRKTILQAPRKMEDSYL